MKKIIFMINTPNVKGVVVNPSFLSIMPKKILATSKAARIFSIII